ncbi:MAG: glycosyltransferase [Bacteroidota bacterium]
MKIEDALQKIVVIIVKKSFWKSEIAKVFPNIFLSLRIYGYSQNKINTYVSFILSLIYIICKQPNVIIFGSAHSLVPLYIKIKTYGFLKNVKFIVTNQIYFSDNNAKYIDRIIIYSKAELEIHKTKDPNKYVFMPLPVDGFEIDSYKIEEENFIFSGGGQDRDFFSLIEAVKSLKRELHIVTFPNNAKEIESIKNDNIKVSTTMPLSKFLSIIAKSKIVVVPLYKGYSSRGHTTIAQGLTLGKPVITCKDSSCDDFIIDGYNGLLVNPGNIDEYKVAIERLFNDKVLYDKLSKNAFLSSLQYKYESFRDELINLINDIKN